jgi:hypothetical protein
MTPYNREQMKVPAIDLTANFNVLLNVSRLTVAESLARVWEVNNNLKSVIFSVVRNCKICF